MSVCTFAGLLGCVSGFMQKFECIFVGLCVCWLVCVFVCLVFLVVAAQVFVSIGEDYTAERLA